MTSEKPPLIHRYTLRQLMNYVGRVPISEIAFIRHAYDLNLALFQEALKSSKATITDYLYSQTISRLSLLTNRRRLLFSVMEPSRLVFLACRNLL